MPSNVDMRGKMLRIFGETKLIHSGNSRGKKPLWRRGRRWKNYINIEILENGLTSLMLGYIDRILWKLLWKSSDWINSREVLKRLQILNVNMNRDCKDLHVEGLRLFWGGGQASSCSSSWVVLPSAADLELSQTMYLKYILLMWSIFYSVRLCQFENK